MKNTLYCVTKFCYFKIDVIKCWLNLVSCNFDMKSYLWFQSNSRCEFMKSRGWFQTKLHSTQFNRNCSPLSPIIHSHLHLIRALFVFSLVKMDNVRQGQRIQIVQNLLTRANEQITKYRREKNAFHTFLKIFGK